MLEHDCVTLTEPRSLDDGVRPPGRRGTIVGLWAPDEVFEVELAESLPAVVTLKRMQVART